jgi:arylsulfatase
MTGRDFTLDVSMVLGERTDGVILATGSHFGGWSFYLKHGRPVAVHAASHQPDQHYRIAAMKTLPEGDVDIRFEYTTDEERPMSGGTLRIWYGNVLLAEDKVAKTALLPNGVGETFDIGMDTGAAVSQDYKREGHFEDTLKKVVLSFE